MQMLLHKFLSQPSPRWLDTVSIQRELLKLFHERWKNGHPTDPSKRFPFPDTMSCRGRREPQGCLPPYRHSRQGAETHARPRGPLKSWWGNRVSGRLQKQEGSS